MFTVITEKTERFSEETLASQLSQACEGVTRKSRGPAYGNEAEQNGSLIPRSYPVKTRCQWMGQAGQNIQASSPVFKQELGWRTAGPETRLYFRPLTIQKPGSSTTCKQNWLCGW